MSEDSSNYETYSQFCEDPDSTTIPHISSFAQGNSRLSPTSPESLECSPPTGLYRELTLVEDMDPVGSAANTNQTSTSPITMQPQTSQQPPQQQRRRQEQQQPGTEQQYAKAVAAAVAAAYQAQAQAQEMGRIAEASMMQSAIHPHPTHPASTNNMASIPPLLPMQVAHSSLLGQALHAANDMGGLPALQLAVQHQQLQQQQQQLLHAVQAAQAQNNAQKMMSPDSSSTDDGESRDEDKSGLVSLMPASNMTPVQVGQGSPSAMQTLTPNSQLRTPNASHLLTSSASSPELAYSMSSGAVASATVPSINMTAGMMSNNQGSNLNMGLAPHFVQLNSAANGASMPVPQMVLQCAGPNNGQQEMVSPEHQMMTHGALSAGITNNNTIDMMSNMPNDCTPSSTKKRNIKTPVPDTDKDDKYFERRTRNNMAAKRSRDSRKRREDQVSMRANFLQKENDILRAQLATLRQEANSLKQLLTQQRPIMPTQMPMQMPNQIPKNNMPQ